MKISSESVGMALTSENEAKRNEKERNMEIKVFIQPDELDDLDAFLRGRSFTRMIHDPRNGIVARWRNPYGGCVRVVQKPGCKAARVVGGWNSLWADWMASKAPSADPEGIRKTEDESDGEEDPAEEGQIEENAVMEDPAEKGGEEE